MRVKVKSPASIVEIINDYVATRASIIDANDAEGGNPYREVITAYVDENGMVALVFGERFGSDHE